MKPDEKVISLIVKLNKLTALNQISWSVEDPPESIIRGTDDLIPLFLSTHYKGRRFGLYQHRYQFYDGDHDKTYWNEKVVLAILDSHERLLWEIPYQPSALYDLFETARKKVANIDDLIEELLSDDESNNSTSDHPDLPF